MKIGGLQKMTLLDYPDKVAATIFTAGCNFACRFCYNAHLVVPAVLTKTPLFSEKDVLIFLASRKKYLDGVCISGGEPTLQADLPEFCGQLKDLGYLIKLDSNGLKPEIIKKLIKEKLIDYVAMDIKAPLRKYAAVVGKKISSEKIKASIKLLLAWQQNNQSTVLEFRSTLVPGLHSLSDVEQMARLVKGTRFYFLQNFIVPGPLVDEKLITSQSFTPGQMAEFAKVAQKYVPTAQVRYNV